MKVVIPAAGGGTRMRKFSKTPKCLMKIGDETVLERTIRICQEEGIVGLNNFAIITGYKSELVLQEIDRLEQKHHIMHTFYNKHWKWTGNVYSLWLAADFLVPADDDVLIMNSDIVFDRKALRTMIGANYDYNISLNGPFDSSSKIDVKIIMEDSNRKVKAIGKKLPSNIKYTKIHEHADLIKVNRRFVGRFVESMIHGLLDVDLALGKFQLENYMISKHALHGIPLVNAKCKEFDTPKEYSDVIKIFT